MTNVFNQSRSRCVSTNRRARWVLSARRMMVLSGVAILAGTFTTAYAQQSAGPAPGVAITPIASPNATDTVTALGASSVSATAAGASATPGEDPLVARGHYLATASDCIACHSVSGGAPFAGGNPIASPVGTIWSTNITPSKQYGIGDYTEAQFAAALRSGIRADGSRLYPAMPYTSYTLMSDDDVHALYAYFMQGVPAVDKAAPRTDLPFPFNMRIAMAGWDALFNRDARFDPKDPKYAGHDAEWLRGAYLVEGPAHCSVCHTPRNGAMAEDDKRALAGAQIGAWYAPNITSDPVAGIGGWSKADLVAFLRTGRVAGRGMAAGPMGEAIEHSFSHLSDADLNAIAAYVKRVPAQRGAGNDAKPAYGYGEPAAIEASLRGVKSPVDNGGMENTMTGAQLYSGNCASCHQASGQGPVLGGAPALLHVSAVGRDNPDNLVMTILHGTQSVTAPDGSSSLMPAFASQLSDAEIARLATFVRQTYGNPQSAAVTAEKVTALRADAPSTTLIEAARWGMAVGVVIVLAILTWLFRRRRRG